MVVGQQSSQSGQEALLAFLSRSVLFSGWPTADLRTIAGWLRPIDVVAGTVICLEGDLGNEMYLIESGQVQVAPGHGRYIYDQLGPGAFFGEIALLGEGRRTAMVTMSVTGRIWALPKTSFDQLLSSRPHLREPLMRLASDRPRVHRAGDARQCPAADDQPDRARTGLSAQLGDNDWAVGQCRCGAPLFAGSNRRQRGVGATEGAVIGAGAGKNRIRFEAMR